jgi:RNA polymerase sigma-70 factor (ECF subfamily)
MSGPVLSSFGKIVQNEERWRGYLKRIGSGDHQSLAQFYDESSGVVYGLALRMLSDPPAAAELVLEVYQQVWTSPETLDTASSVLASLTTITRNLALVRLRKAEKNPHAASGKAVPAAVSPPGSVLRYERELVMRALALLDPAQREAIELAFFCGMTDVELASALGVSPHDIRTRITRGMRKFNEALKLVNSTEGNA